MMRHSDLFLTLRAALLIAGIVMASIIFPVNSLILTAGEQQEVTPVFPKGDPVVIRGVATGHPQQGLQVWILGNNYAHVSTVSVNADNSYQFKLVGQETQNLASGQYFVLIQHPMMNGEFDIVYNAGTGQVINRQRGGGMAIFSLTGAGSLQGPQAAEALLSAVKDPDTDDSFTTVSFYVEPPHAFIDPISNYAVGDRFEIGGSTNLAPGDDLLIEVYSSSFHPTTKEQGGEFSGITGMVKVQPGPGNYNHWSFPVDTKSWKPDEYIVTVSAILQNVRESTTFIITEKRAPAITLSASSQVTTMLSTTTATTGPHPSTQETPVTAFTILAGPLLAFLLWYNRDNL
jgi:hypothetical protein